MASKYKQTKSLHCDLPFTILFVMFPLAVPFKHILKVVSLEAEIGWQACIYYLFLKFYLLLPIYHCKNFFFPLKWMCRGSNSFYFYLILWFTYFMAYIRPRAKKTSHFVWHWTQISRVSVGFQMGTKWLKTIYRL